MVRRQWQLKIEQAWREKSVVWLTGVRRSGKTTLCKGIAPDALFDCELPRIRMQFADPEEFFLNVKRGPIAIDEIHRLENASEVLKIAADYFPKIKVLATGSSVLAAGKRFKDTLTDRKRIVFLTPMSLEDLDEFKSGSLKHRLERGGLPPFFLAKKFPEAGYQEWMDSFWAKDIEELFDINKKHAFLKFFELLALQSGGMFEAQSFAVPCGVSHTTIAAYLNIMVQTHTAYVLRPFHRNLTKEIISAPKVYFFDTGLITYFKGLTQLSDSDRGPFWEHFVLNQLLTQVDRTEVHYWRDKSKNEVDFIVKRRGQGPIAIECKWSSKEFNPSNVRKFREIHQGDVNLVIASDITEQKIRKFDGLKVIFCPLRDLNQFV